MVAVGSVADPLIAAIRDRIARIKIGPGLEEGSGDGPAHHARAPGPGCNLRVENAAAEGAIVAVDGRTDKACQRSGFFLGATLLDHVKPGMRCYDDEIFGPVLSVVRVEKFDQALRIINDNPYGNGTAIFTRDGGAARQFQFQVDVGTWWASTFRSRFRSPTTALADGRPRFSVTFICTARKECSSIRKLRW